MPRLKPMTEHELLAETIKLCEQLGLLYHHCPDGRGCRGQRGLPDLIVLGGNGLAMLELKSADGEPSADQALWAWTLHKIGATYALMQPLQLETGELRTFLEGLT